MAIILYKLPRFTEVNGHEKVVSKAGEWYVEDTSKDFSTSFCVVPTNILQKPGKHVIGKDEFIVMPAQPIDEYRQLAIDVQKIGLKDLGFIASYVGVHKDMVVGESGTGSGGATLFFAPLVKHVHSFDVRQGAIDKVEQDLDKQEITNVTLKVSDVQELECPEVDVFLLDVPQPWDAWKNMGCVKPGGWVVGYTPSANQLQQFVLEAPENFKKVHACEVIERHWKVEGKALRPVTADHSHTAFLSFFRRLY